MQENPKFYYRGWFGTVTPPSDDIDVWSGKANNSMKPNWVIDYWGSTFGELWVDFWKSIDYEMEKK